MDVGFWHHLGNFFYSNFFVGLVALGVGVAAYSVYRRRRRDAKRDAANVILLEIESAEQQLQAVNQAQAQDPNSLPEAIFLMKNSSWDKHRYHFVRDFDRNEWDKITDFYDKCRRYDEAVTYNNSFFQSNLSSWVSSLHHELAKYASAYADTASQATPAQQRTLEQAYLKRRKTLIDVYTNVDPQHTYFHNPVKPINDAKAVLTTIETSLSLTSVGTKLKRLAWNKSIITRLRDWVGGPKANI